MKQTLGQRMFAHGGIYALSRLIKGGISFLLIPLYAHLIGDEGYGIIELMTALGMAVSIVFLQGLPSAWFRLRFDQPDAKQLGVFEATIVWYLLASIVIGIGILSVFGERLAKVATPGVSYYPLGLLTVISAGLLAFSDLYQRKCQAEQQPIRFAVFTAMRSLLIPGSIIIGVLALGRGVQGKIEADVVSAAIIATVA
ncbi:MAG: oligosaccharide flippase family protein, partial [Planctomycetes bacterium]|nr:oligosaccharide flippase family protein [Planctomycetota bacterium]